MAARIKLVISGSSVLHVVMSVCIFGAIQFLNVFILTLPANSFFFQQR